MGVEVPSGGANLEVKPYILGMVKSDLAAEPPYHNKAEANAGADGKYGVTRSLTADVTLNTDFAQVESDEQQVNLTRFDLFFPEKREFFLEGAGIFAFGAEEARKRFDQGFRFASIGADLGTMIKACEAMLAAVRDFTVGGGGLFADGTGDMLDINGKPLDNQFVKFVLVR